MENTIDRKAYRRNSYDNYEREEKVQVKRSENLFLNKVINAMLLLLFILSLKFFYFEEQFNFVKENFYNGFTYEVIEEKLKEKMNEFNMDKNKYVDSNLNIEKINVLLDEEIKESGEVLYQAAIDGVNQLKTDSEIIKTNYEIKIPLKGVITSKFGTRVSDNPIVSSYHTGVDIAADTGTNIVAAHSGKITLACENGSYGKCVVVESGDLTTLYAHCSDILVNKGDIINSGKNIAKVGMTGNATGPHLHFEVKYQDRIVNPEDIIKFGEE